MKILFINISDTKGGSAKAAYQLGKQLEKDYHTENLFLVRSKFSNDHNVFSTRRNKLEHVLERGANIIMNAIGLQYQWLPFSPKMILRKAREFNPDIISLHNTIGGYYKTKDLIKLSEIAPIVWTIHDMWPITRNASHTYGDESFKKMKPFKGERKIFPWIGIESGRFLIKQKKKIYQNSEITVVCPSQWLCDLVRSSPLLAGKRIEKIYHGINTSIYRKMDKSRIREELGIRNDAKVIMFAAQKLQKKSTKGGSELAEIIRELNTNRNTTYTILMVGETEYRLTSSNNLDYIYTGYVNDEELMAKYYNAADVFVYPTKAESFGLVLAEAISCGTPCVSFDVGPVKEIVPDNIAGFTFKPDEIAKMISLIKKILGDEEKLQNLSHSGQEYALKNFSLSTMATKYFGIFKNISPS